MNHRLVESAGYGEAYTDSGFKVELVGNETMRANWGSIEPALRTAFTGSDYNIPGYTDDNPVDFTLRGIEGKMGTGLKHVLTRDSAGQVLGGFFCIPTERTEHETDCDVGWVFLMPNLTSFRDRLAIMDSMVGLVIETVRSAGYQRMVTKMGTAAGAKSLKRYSINHEPTAEEKNRWVLIL